jgi:hypothetical protein
MADSDNERGDMMASDVFMEELTKLEKRLSSTLDQQRQERHMSNNRIHSNLLSLTEKTEGQDKILAEIQQTMRGQTDSLRRIETRLVGDPALGSTGLSQDFTESKSKISLLESRVGACEKEVKDGARDRAQDRKIVVYAIGVIGAIGGLVTWLKATGVLTWLSSK